MPAANKPKLQLSHVRITRRDLAGKNYGPTNRTFLVVIDQELAKKHGYSDDNENPVFGERALDKFVQALQEENWPVRYFGEGDEAAFNDNIRNGEYPDAWLSCKVRYNTDPSKSGMNPKVFYKVGDTRTELDESSISTIDSMEIDYSNVEVSLNHWTYGTGRNAREGYTAYVQRMFVWGVNDNTDDFANEFFADIEPDELEWS